MAILELRCLSLGPAALNVWRILHVALVALNCAPVNWAMLNTLLSDLRSDIRAFVERSKHRTSKRVEYTHRVRLARAGLR